MTIGGALRNAGSMVERNGEFIVNTGLAKTFAVLAKSKNEAATAILLPTLDAADPELQRGALGALLDRRSPAGQREILNRLPSMDDEQRKVIDERRGRLSTALREALLGDDDQACHNACQAIMWFREYDQAPLLVNAIEDPANSQSNLAATTLRTLCEQLYGELASKRDYAERRDPQLVRRHVLVALESSVQRYTHHKNNDILETFLLLAGRDNVVLKSLLKDPYSDVYRAAVDILTHSEQAGVMRLLLGFLDDASAPSAGINVIAHRTDHRFLRLLFERIGTEPNSRTVANLKRIEKISWIDDDLELLEDLDDEAQHGVVQFVMRTSVRRDQSLKVISYLLNHASEAGRRAAAAQLPEFSGVEANNLAIAALADRDPEVQAIVLSQLRQRGIPGAVTHLIERADSPYEVVRNAVRESLAEFTFAQFVTSFDMLDEETQLSTAQLVRKIDPDSVPLLGEELRAQSRTRRIRGLGMAVAMEMVHEVESQIVHLLSDSDHIMRCEAATALAHAHSDFAITALRSALDDSSVAVQEAAESSLESIVGTADGDSPADNANLQEEQA